MIVISFCIYGSNIKYCKGIDENLKIMKKRMEKFNAFIYIGTEVPEEYIQLYKSYDFVQLFYTHKPGAYNMIARFLAIDEPNVDIMIVRDADSRLHNRDRWIIDNFINSSYGSHTIRDHPWHTARMMGGLFGIKKNAFSFNMIDLYNQYNPSNDISGISWQYDQTFLRNVIYPILKKNMLIYVFHPKIQLEKDENIKIIPLLVKNNNFCGAVIDYDVNGCEKKEFLWDANWNYNNNSG